MNKNEANKKNEKKQNPPCEPKKKAVKNNDDLNDMLVEGACSPEFSEGCKAIDDETDE